MSSPEPEILSTSEPEAEGTAEPEAESTSEPEAEGTVEPEAEGTTEPEAEGTAEPEGTGEPEAEGTAEPEAEGTGEPEAEGTGEPEAEGTAEPEAEGTAEPEAEATGEPEAEGTAEPEAEGTGEPEAEGTAKPEAEGTAEPEAEGTAEPEAEGTAEPEAEGTAEPENWLTNSTHEYEWWPSMCQRPLLQGERPSSAEIFVPPMLLTTLLMAGLISLIFYDRWKSKKHCQFWDRALANPKCNNIANSGTVSKIQGAGFNLDDALGNSDVFYDDFDLEVLSDLSTKNNKFSTLLKLCIPSLASLALASSFMFTQDIVFNCMWPRRVRPDINTAVTCFLAPAGLVYALSFGFTFQQVLEKHRAILNKITTEMSMMDQMVTMTCKLRLPSKKHAMAMFKCIKSETVFMGMQIQKRGVESFKNQANPLIQVHVWQILDILRDAASQGEDNFNLNRLLVDNMVSYMVELNSICSDRMGSLHARIHPLKWVFLEVLGTVTLFGVMLIDATSRRMELMMCELTIFSVSMLCYVLADIDSAFNGFFRVDTSVLPDVVKRLENLYRCAHIEHQLEEAMNEKGLPQQPHRVPEVSKTADTNEEAKTLNVPTSNIALDLNKANLNDGKGMLGVKDLNMFKNISASGISLNCSDDGNNCSRRSSAKPILTSHN